MSYNGSLIDHKYMFNELVESLAQIGKIIDSYKLIILCTNSHPMNIFNGLAIYLQANVSSNVNVHNLNRI